MEFIGFLALVALLVIVLRMRGRLYAAGSDRRSAGRSDPAAQPASTGGAGYRRRSRPIRRTAAGAARVARSRSSRSRNRAEARRTSRSAAGAAAEERAEAFADRRRRRPHPRRRATMAISNAASAPNGWSGSAGSRSRSAAFSWCAIRSRPACSDPGMRIILGAISRARRWSALANSRAGAKSLAASAQINGAHIPSILTAAGTTVAYADDLGGLRALRFPLAGHRLRAARRGGARNARGRAAARTGAGGPRSGRRLS